MQKTAYDMRMSDWSSDVCSSDLIISALVVGPIAAYGFRRSSRVKNWTQPVWLLLQLAPLLFIIQQGPAAVALWTGYNGNSDGLDKVSTGLALAVFLSLLPQIGEQVDYQIGRAHV